MGVFDLFKQDNPDIVHRRDADCQIEDLGSDNPIIRQNAADHLQAGGRRVLLPLLERIRMADEPLKVQIVCVLLNLQGITPSEIFAGLRTTCRMENNEIICLFSLPGRNAIPGLLKYMADNDSAARSSAAEALVRIGEPALPLLNKALTHRSHRIRSGAADTLTRMNRVPKKFDDYCHFLIAQERWSELIRAKKTAVPFLIAILPDRYYRIRMDAAKALGAIGDPQAVQALGDLLADSENEVCISAIEALGKIQHKTAIPHLVSSLSHASYNVRHMAATTLSAYGWSPDTTEERALFYLASEQWNDLARMGRPAVPFLIQALENPRCGLQEGVAAALKGMGKPGRDALVAASSHKNPVIRKAAEKILNEGHTSKRRATGPAYHEPSKEVVSARNILGATPAVTTRPDTVTISTPEKAENCRQIPKRQDMGGQLRRSEPAAQEPPGKVPVMKRSLPDCLKSRVPEIPDPYPKEEQAPYEREPDFSGCVREEMPDSDTTDEEILSLIGSLSSTDENIRAIAVDSLGRIGVRAIGALTGALGDPSWEVRLAAAEALGRIENEQAIYPLINALHDKDAEVRAAAARSLGKISNFSAFAPLARSLEDPDSRVRRNAESALVAFGNQVAAPVKKLLVSPNHLVRGSAAMILGATGGEEALLDLVSLFDDTDGSVRERAAVALGTIGPLAFPQLAEIFTDKDPKRRLCAVIGFGHAGPEAEEFLLTACRDLDPAVRERARAFLNARHTGTKSPDTAYQVIEGLYPDITDTTPSPPGIRNDEGIAVMDVHIPENAGNTPTDTMNKRSPDNNCKTRAEATGSKEPAAHLIGPLIDALASPVPQTRILAVQSLGRIGDPRAVLPLVSLLGEKDPVMRQIAAEALGEIGDTGAIPDLIRLLEDPLEQVRKSAARALGKIGHDDTVPGLIGALTDDDYSVRAEAGDILVRMGNTAIPHLVLALTHPSRKIRRETAFCLDQLGWVPVEIPDQVHYLIAKEAWLELSGMEEAALCPLRRLVLASAEEDLRIGAILVLVKMENISAIGLLIQALRDKSFLIRHKAMNALVDKGESAISPLREAVNSDDEHIRTASEQILERINRKCSA